MLNRFYKTVQGEFIDLRDLTPYEGRHFFHLIKMSGGESILGSDWQNATHEGKRLSPRTFLAYWGAQLRATMTKEQLACAINGPFWKLVEDIAFRLSILAGENTIHEYEKFAHWTKNSSNIFPNENPPSDLVTIRDFAHQEIGRRMLALAATFYAVGKKKLAFGITPEEFRCILLHEYTARCGILDKIAFESLFLHTCSMVEQFQMQTKHPILVQLPVGSTEDVLPWTFLFLALEWNWLEDVGNPVVLIPSSIKYGAMPIHVLLPDVEMKQEEEPDGGLHIHDCFVQNTLYEAGRANPVPRSSLTDDTGKVINMLRFRERAVKLLCAKKTSSLACEVINRWCKAYGHQDSDVSLEMMLHSFASPVTLHFWSV